MPLTAGDLLKDLVAVLDESPYDGAWTHPQLLGYLAEGQDNFCEETGYFIDPMTFTFPTVADSDTYPISPRIIRVLNAYVGSRELLRYEEQDKPKWYEWDGEITQSSGAPTAFQTDQAPGYVTLWPVPQGVHTIRLRVWRYALKHLCEDGEHTLVELPPQFARAAVEFAAYKALNHHDMELQDPVKARDHWDHYQDYIRRGRESLRRLRGSEHRVGPSPVYVV